MAGNNSLLSVLRATPLSNTVATQQWVQEEFTPISLLVDELSGEINPKLSTIADKVIEEAEKIQEISSSISNYVKLSEFNEAVLSIERHDTEIKDVSSSINSLSTETITALSNVIDPKLDTISSLVSTEVERIDEISTSLSSYALSSSLNQVAFTGSYTDLSDVPEVFPASNGVLTINVNGISAGSFSADQSDNTAVNISVPLSTSQLSNDSGFVSEAKATEIRNVLPIAESTASFIQLTRSTYVYRVTDETASGAFPTLVAPTDIENSGNYYFTFEIEWTTAATLASYSQTFDWINWPEIVQGSESHTYYIAGRWDSVAGTYTMNCWRTK